MPILLDRVEEELQGQAVGGVGRSEERMERRREDKVKRARITKRLGRKRAEGGDRVRRECSSPNRHLPNSCAR